MCAVYNIPALAAEILGAGRQLRFQAQGGSMRPFIRAGDILEIHPYGQGQTPPLGAVVLIIDNSGRLLAHRVVRRLKKQDNFLFVTQGDALVKPDAPIEAAQVLGSVAAILRDKRRIPIQQGPRRTLGMVWLALTPLRRPLIALWRGMLPLRSLVRHKFTGARSTNLEVEKK